MMTPVEAKEIAMTFTSELGEMVPGIFYSVGSMKEHNDCYYFDFLFVDKDGNTPNSLSIYGGAPGVTVSKQSGETQIITFAQLWSLSSR